METEAATAGRITAPVTILLNQGMVPLARVAPQPTQAATSMTAHPVKILLFMTIIGNGWNQSSFFSEPRLLRL